MVLTSENVGYFVERCIATQTLLLMNHYISMFSTLVFK